ncbi:MAG: hypothetical protein FWH22_05805, partial [Fibromonadales bacterium]|nr:hypothetical protein [Fibromonadales bacterium]
GNFWILDDAYWTEDILSNTCPPGYEYEYENAIYAYKSIAPAGKSLGKAQKPKVSSKQKISSKVLSAVSKIKQ